MVGYGAVVSMYYVGSGGSQQRRRQASTSIKHVGPMNGERTSRAEYICTSYSVAVLVMLVVVVPR